MALSKKEMSANLISENIAIFACPHCGGKVRLEDQKTIVCDKNHSFDLAKQGYVFMLTHGVTSMYDQSLFEARKIVIDQMLYQQMYAVVIDILQSLGNKLFVLDTGCGEGTHLYKIQQQFDGELIASGIDIAKEGIQAAAKNYNNMMWIVGDLAKSPYATESFDAILNILSPANYEEFKRISKPNGKIIKVVPQSGYLKELRALYYSNSDKEEYSNDKTVERFKENFDDVVIERVKMTTEIPSDLVPLLMHMTPMGWHQDQKIDANKLPQITIDLDILVGTVKK